MKKIFAIALALVMVLSMASAFAAPTLPGTCDWSSWDCTTYTTNCGVAKAEVVKFVRTNDCDPYVESDCAAVVKGMPVYFGVKVTFDESVNEQWYNDTNTVLDITFSKLVTADGGSTAVPNITGKSIVVPGKNYKQVAGKTYWYDFAAQSLVAERSDACIGWGYAASTGVKVCANVSYSHNGLWTAAAPLSMGKYDIVVAQGTGAASKDYSIVMTDKATGDTATFGVSNGTFNMISFGGKNYNVYANGKFYAIDYTSTGDACTYVDEMLAFLKLSLGDCVTADGIKAFFGWDDDDAFEACTTWSKNAAAVVDAECVVAIPKTGDASVLAWLF